MALQARRQVGHLGERGRLGLDQPAHVSAGGDDEQRQARDGERDRDVDRGDTHRREAGAPPPRGAGRRWSKRAAWPREDARAYWRVMPIEAM